MKKVVLSVLILSGLTQSTVTARDITIRYSSIATGAALVSAATCAGLAIVGYHEELDEKIRDFVRSIEDARDGTLNKALIISGAATVLFGVIAYATQE